MTTTGFVTLADGSVHERVSGSQIVRRRFTNGEKYRLVAEYQAQLPPKWRKVTPEQEAA